jgi:hypothetical protein
VPSDKYQEPLPPTSPASTIVGREAELAQLQRWLEQARSGTQQLVFVTGEPGLGKTAVVSAFLARVGTPDECWSAQGQCVEHYGAGEAYLPVLAAFDALSQTAAKDQPLPLLRQHAPLAYLPQRLSHTTWPTRLARVLHQRTEGNPLFLVAMAAVAVSDREQRRSGLWGTCPSEIAAELALHFEQGRDYPRAVHYLQHAGENALRKSALQEAISHLTKGLELLKALPDTPERVQQELALRDALGPALIATRGYATAEAEDHFTRVGGLLTGATSHTGVLGSLERLVTKGAETLQGLLREDRAVQEKTEALSSLAGTHQFPLWSAVGTILHGWTLTAQGQQEEGIVRLCQGLNDHRATRSAAGRKSFRFLEQHTR